MEEGRGVWLGLRRVVSFGVVCCWDFSGLSPSCRPLGSDSIWSVSDGLSSPMCSLLSPSSGSAALRASSNPFSSAFSLRLIPSLQSLSCCSLSSATRVLGFGVVRSF